MQNVEVSDLKERINEFLHEDDEYELCPYGIKENEKIYYYGYIDEKGYFITDEDGTLVSKDEALLVFESFVHSWSILTHNLNHFLQCANKRPLSAFERLSYNLKKFSKKYLWKNTHLENDIKSVQHMLAVIFDGQDNLKEKAKQLETFKNEKFKESLHFEKDDIEQLVILNNEMNWILYQQTRSIEDTIASMKQILSSITNDFSFAHKYLNFTVLSTIKLMKQFTSEKTIEQNRESLKTFELNHNGNYITFPEGDIGLNQFNKNMNKRFEVEFNKLYVSKLFNRSCSNR